MLLVLIILILLFMGGGYGLRTHPTYGSYSTGGIGLGGLLLIILLIMLLTGYQF